MLLRQVLKYTIRSHVKYSSRCMDSRSYKNGYISAFKPMGYISFTTRLQCLSYSCIESKESHFHWLIFVILCHH